MEPSPFNPKWYSHKFHGPGIRYEIGICIRTGHVVWAYGGLPCGEWPDLRLARSHFILKLQAGEKAIADRGYNDQNFLISQTALMTRRKNKYCKARNFKRAIKTVLLLERKIPPWIVFASPLFPCCSKFNADDDWTWWAIVFSWLLIFKYMSTSFRSKMYTLCVF